MREHPIIYFFFWVVPYLRVLAFFLIISLLLFPIVLLTVFSQTAGLVIRRVPFPSIRRNASGASHFLAINAKRTQRLSKPNKRKKKLFSPLLHRQNIFIYKITIIIIEKFVCSSTPMHFRSIKFRLSAGIFLCSAG